MYYIWILLTPIIAGHYECGRMPEAAKYIVAKTLLSAEIEYDEDFEVILNHFARRAGLPLPATTVADADRLYIQLRADAHDLLD